MADLIKTLDVPSSAQKNPMMCPRQLKIYFDRVECIGGQGNVFFFKDYTGIGLQAASLYCAFASVTFLNSVNSGQLPKNGTAMLSDRNRINFCSGTFSYAAANDFMKKAFIEIKSAFEQYKQAPAEPVSTTIVNERSDADEILKFKGLLDSGIITQEEFEAKKKQLLGL